MRTLYKGIATQRWAVGQGQLGRLLGGGEAVRGWRRWAGKGSQGRRNLPRSTGPQWEPRWLIGWLETRLLPVPRRPSQIPAEPRVTPSPEGNATLPQSKLDQRLAVQVDPERILLKCRFSAFLTGSQVTPGTQVPGPHFE